MSTSDLNAIAQSLKAAKVPEDVFGVLGSDRIRSLTLTYRRMAVLCHPDKYQGTSDEHTASGLFHELTQWRESAEHKIRSGTYGDRKPVEPAKPVAATVAQVIKTAKRTYTVDGLVAHGDLADVYRCTYRDEAGTEVKAIFKVARAPGDNDLMEAESKTLTAIFPAKEPQEKFYRYLPRLLDTFMFRGSSGSSRRCNVLQAADGYVSVQQILDAYPKGLDFRDVAWIFKRGLAAIGYAHGPKAVVHGAVLPDHILVHPVEHGARLVDWCYAVPVGGTVKALSTKYKGFYAPEILAKKPATAATDIYMLAKTMVALLGGSAVPVPLQAFLQSCLIESQARRPDDAWELHGDLDEVLERVVGKPKYRKLHMPAV